jgi:hypothetical protein
MARPADGVVSMSPYRCAVCRHEDREAIDQDLIRKRRTQADIARQIGVDRSTVSRHYKNHVLPVLASAMISSPSDVTIGTLLSEFDRLYGSNEQIREIALVERDPRLAKDVNIEQRRLLEVLLKHGDKIGTRSVPDAIGLDRERWAQLERETAARYRRVAEEWVYRALKGVVTLSELPDDVRDRITEIALRAKFPDGLPAVAEDADANDAGNDSTSSQAGQAGTG